MTNEEKAIEIMADFPNDNTQLSQEMYDIFLARILEMAEWKDEELKKDILELEAKNDVLKSCLRDAKNEIKILKNK